MNNQPVTVYYISKRDTFTNSHFVCRDETWKARPLMTKFKNIEEAKEYIRKMSMVDIVRYQMPPTKEFIEEFCFGDTYYHERLYFIGGPPDWKKMRECLEKRSINVIRLNTS